MHKVQGGVHKDTALVLAEAKALAVLVELKIHMMKGRRLFCPTSDTSPSAKELERCRNSIQERADSFRQQAR